MTPADDGYGVDERTDEKPKSAYLSRSELRFFVLFAVIAFVALIPAYYVLKAKAEQYECHVNLEQIGKAMELYAERNDDRLPPAYVTADNPGSGLAPMLDDKGRPFTWAGLIKDEMNARATFVCPAASEDEIVDTQYDQKTDIPMSYGMFAPYSAYPENTIDNPAATVLVGETSNFGSQDTCDPVPFVDASGAVIRSDGFLIGFDKSNFDGAHANYVTRLAYYDSKGGVFKKKGGARHEGGIYLLFADGHTEFLNPLAAQVTLSAQGIPGPPWTTPPSLDQFQRH